MPSPPPLCPGRVNREKRGGGGGETGRGGWMSGGIPSPFLGGCAVVVVVWGEERKEGDPVETEATDFVFPQQHVQQTLV